MLVSGIPECHDDMHILLAPPTVWSEVAVDAVGGRG
jgi:hypothetical protein